VTETNEFPLLCGLSNDGAETSPAEQIHRLCRSGINWDLLLRLALRHKVATLIDRRLAIGDLTMIPTGFTEAVRKHAAAVVRENRRMRGELIRLLGLFDSIGIPAIAFKGTVLSDIAYGDPLLREAWDLDLLVHKADLLKARDMMLSLEYTRRYLDFDEESRLKSRYEKSATFVRRIARLAGRDRFEVELHWQLRAAFGHFPMPELEIWKNSVVHALGQAHIRSLSPEDLLLYVCVHACGDRWDTLRSVCDVAGLVRRHPMTWSTVFRTAARLRCLRRTLFGLELARVLLRLELPDEVAARIANDRKVVSLVAWSVRKMTRPRSGARQIFNRCRYDLLLYESYRNKFVYVFDMVALGLAHACGIRSALSLAESVLGNREPAEIEVG
jgi:hypothetical protein